MSSLVLSGDTSGAVTIAAPAVAGTTTLTLPARTSSLMADGPAFSAYMSTATQSINNTTFTKIQVNTEEFDTATCYDNATNYRFTPNVAGYYQISGGVAFAATTGNSNIATIYKNGAEYKRGQQGGILECNVECLVYLNGTTDYVELYGYQASGGAMNVSGTQVYFTYFQGCLVRGA